VTPIVGILEWPCKLTLDHNEVTKAFSIPINWLLDKENWNQKEIEIPNRGRVTTIVFRDYNDEHLWGLTARMTIDLLYK
jgi:hypothetical protein